MKKEWVERLYQFNVVHGQHLVGESINYLDILSKEVIISEDVQIVCVDEITYPTYIEQKKIIGRPIYFKKYKKYNKWSTKIIGLYEFINENYNNLPNYIMYLDSLDTMLIKDLLNPKEMLNYYNCKILFNCETYGGGFSGYYSENDPSNYWDNFDNNFLKFKKLSEKKYCTKDKTGSLNAGVFIGEKKFVKEIISTMYAYLMESTSKGFPYGTGADQEVFKYIQMNNFDDIGIDLFHKYFFWGPEGALDPNPENIFSINYLSNLYKNTYESKIKYGGD